MSDVTIRAEDTPNPNARRYVVNRPVQQDPKGRFFTSGKDAGEPLVEILFELEGVAGVMLLPNSVTVNKANAASWDELDGEAQRRISGYFV
ncbi:MAG: NifU N-terminal domain-containing protein [Actinomycetota bacterium]